MVTKKVDFIPLNPLIPSNFSKKSSSTDLLGNSFRDIKEKGILSKYIKQITIKISFLIFKIEKNKE